MTTTPLTDLSPEILQNILEYVGDPTLGQVSKSMQKNITAVTKLELQKIWDKVKRSPNDFEDLNYTQHVFRNIAIAYKKRIPLMDRIDGNMPRICYERFHCIYKKIIAQDTLTVWKQLPGGENYLNTPI
ncbi:MAG: hypothetical protein KAR79_05550, partial [Simkaniaceae bacterium]|nr:hypothetical protein [Simkaniaceae bacterium]